MSARFSEVSCGSKVQITGCIQMEGISVALALTILKPFLKFPYFENIFVIISQHPHIEIYYFVDKYSI